MRLSTTHVLALVAMMLPVSMLRADEEWEQNTIYYEDDAWYDVSEWFDGNDYNPTDEEIFEWDDEVYQPDPDSFDYDNDINHGYYTPHHDWMYDHYDATVVYDNYDFDNNLYEIGTRYYDYDNDGAYDAFASWYDWDNDGLYEDYEYYSFNDVGTEEQEEAAKSNAPQSAKRASVAGVVDRLKKVDVRGKQHLVVAVGQGDEQQLLDLGVESKQKREMINEGTRLTATGPKLAVGDKQILMAQSVTIDDETMGIDRSQNQLSGTVIDTRSTKIRGKEHTIALVQRKGKNKRVAVDMGPSGDLPMNLKQDENVTLRGVPVEVSGRKMFFANKIERDGDWVRIQRAQPKDKATS